MTRGEQLRLAVAAAPPDGPHRVNDVAGGEQPRARRLRVTDVAAAQQTTLCEQLRPRGAVDRAVDPASTKQGGVRGVDDRVDVLFGDVTANDVDHRTHVKPPPFAKLSRRS